jgi:hypothetical protein
MKLDETRQIRRMTPGLLYRSFNVLIDLSLSLLVRNPFNRPLQRNELIWSYLSHRNINILKFSLFSYFG